MMGDCPHWQPATAVIIVVVDLFTWLIISLSLSLSLSLLLTSVLEVGLHTKHLENSEPGTRLLRHA